MRSTPASEMLMERLNFYRRIELSPSMRERRRAARRYLRGEGIEIGALHIRQVVPRGARLRFVDRFDQHEARRVYPELRTNQLVEVDIVDDGETLATIETGSLDFIIANHMIEHCENPLQTLENWRDKLRLDGVIFMAIPDMAHTFDRKREPTSPEHLLRDWQEGSDWSLREHYEEFGRHVNQLSGAALDDYVEAALQKRENIHFHAWRAKHFLSAVLCFERELCARRHLGDAFNIELCQGNGAEFLVVLRKS